MPPHNRAGTRSAAIAQPLPRQRDPVATTRRGRTTNRTALTTPPVEIAHIVQRRSLSQETFDNTDSDNDSSLPDAPQDLPPVLVSPVKRRARAEAVGINKKTDLDVWELSDFEIMGQYVDFVIQLVTY